MNIINSIFNYFWKRKALKYISEVDSYLNVISNIKKADLENNINELRRERHQIDECLKNEMIGLFKNEINYLEQDKPFANNEKASAILYKKQNYFKMLPEFQMLTKSFMFVKDDFLGVVNKIPEIVNVTNKQIDEECNNAKRFVLEVNENKKSYFANSNTQKSLEKYAKTYSFYTNGELKTIQNLMVKEFLVWYRDLNGLVSLWNKEFISRELEEQKQLLSNIDGKSLDIQQRTAIVTDEDNNLVIAGAGSGKTLTISGKVKYLIEVKQVKPEEILLISFTKKSSEEMYERISKKLGLNVEVKTFHKLGMEIIANDNRAKPDVLQNPDELINSYMFKEIYNNNDQIKNIIEFFGYYINIPKDYEEFENLGEYHEHYRNVDFETIKSKMDKTKYVKSTAQELAQNLKTISGESVESLEELLIANYLFLNGVKYEYEKEYEYNTRDKDHRQYKPDFYLPEYKIYLEHFGVNEEMRVPWLNGFEEDQYIEGIHWKRELHNEKKTKLIESYSYYNKHGILLEKLEENLIKNNVQLKQVDFSEIFYSVYNQGKNRFFSEFIKLVGTFINLFKSNGFDIEKFESFIKENYELNKENPFILKRTQVFFELVEPIFIYYQEVLNRNKQIDFNDMINSATKIVQSGAVHFNYKYIIIDEFQDISQSRYKLVNAIKKQTQAKIMCVGDDWQSIFRFAGSDLKLFTSFDKYFGFNETLRIEKTYRNSKKLIDIAGDFVMKNNQQYKKQLKSDKQNNSPIKLIGFQKDKVTALIKAIDSIISKYGEDTEIMLLGRNNFDVQFLEKSMDFSSRVDRNSGQTIITYSKYKKLKIYFLTVHKSKGLEAENVIIVNAENSLVGFPSKITDDPLLSYVLTDNEQYEFAEERRLFYVALTRTKNYTYILSPEYKMSSFVKELQKNHKIQYVKPTHESSIINNPSCPRCQSGFMVLRSSNKGHFLGCVNFPKCDYTINEPEVMNKQVTCSNCGSYLVKRSGRYGAFYGCVNFPKCKNTESVKTSNNSMVTPQLLN